ncbi:MAG: TlpA family protein disulfide reductase [Bacteroidales bacterium]|nr:TlpA family protein disulfide reductase [Bacteroidales bacterium]
MRNFSIVALAALLLAGCTSGARLNLNVPDAPGAKLVVTRLNVNSIELLDTVTTNSSGHAGYKVEVAEGQPEFVYVFYNGTKIASLLLQAGDAVSVTADTLGKYSVEGSPESAKLAGIEAAARRFGSAMLSTDDPAELARIYIEHYRESVKYVLSNQRSLTVIPVLYEQVDEATPLFSQYSDAILFRQTADTLKTVYPESPYVKALDKEASRREHAFSMHRIIGSAGESGFPDLSLSGIAGTPVTLSEIDAKAVLVHFWDSSDAAQKMFNLDVLLPLWKKWHDRGFEIYAIDINSDKAVWASVVRAQELPWVNVNGGRGNVHALSLYNVGSLPASFLLLDGTLSSAVLDTKSLEKELAAAL